MEFIGEVIHEFLLYALGFWVCLWLASDRKKDDK